TGRGPWGCFQRASGRLTTDQSGAIEATSSRKRSHTVSGSYSTDGTITFKLSVTDVGESSTGTAVFNVIDSTRPCKVVILTSPHSPQSGICLHGSRHPFGIHRRSGSPGPPLLPLTSARRARSSDRSRPTPTRRRLRPRLRIRPSSTQPPCSSPDRFERDGPDDCRRRLP